MCAAVVNTLLKAIAAKVVKVVVVIGARDGRLCERADYERERRAKKGGAHKPTHTYVTSKTGRRASNHYGDSFRVVGLVSVLMRFALHARHADSGTASGTPFWAMSGAGVGGSAGESPFGVAAATGVWGCGRLPSPGTCMALTAILRPSSV